MEFSNSTYLGDGLYARWQGDMLVIFAYDSIDATNTVYLDPEVLAALMKFLKVKNG